jgi:hypothetical protein
MTENRFYRVEYLGKTYEFAFRYESGREDGFRAYILKAPGYGFRSSSLSATHRRKDDSGHYICWSERIRSKSSMDAVTALWCKATVMYIVHGGKSLDAYAEKLMKA